MNLDPRRVAAVLHSQTLEFVRDFGSVFLSLIFPLLFVVALVGSNLVKPSFEFTFGVVDPHHNVDTRQLLGALAAPGISFKSVDAAHGRADLEDGKLQALLTVPAAPLRTGAGAVQALTDTKFQSVVSMALDAARARLMLAGPDADRSYPVKVRTFRRSTDNKFAFIFPGMLALALVQLGMFATATPLLKARERGSLRYLLLSPLTILELLVGQVGMRVLLAMLQVGLLLGAGAVVVHLSLGTWLAVAGVAMLGVAMLVSIGYCVAGLPRSLESGMALIMILNFVLIFGGNIFWDPRGSVALEVVAHLLPASYLADALRQTIEGRDGLWPLWLDFVAMVGWTLAAVALAARTFSFDMTRHARRRLTVPLPRVHSAAPN